jgi:hypothetical protein
MIGTLARLALLCALPAASGCANATSDEAPAREGLAPDGGGESSSGRTGSGDPPADEWGEPSRDGEDPEIHDGGEPCGPTPACPQDMVCCNPSCGICAPPDGYCTQQVCSDA